MKWHSRAFALLVVVLALLALAPPALAAPLSQTPPIDWFTATLSQLIAWVVSFALAAAVAYVVAQLPLSDTWKTALAHVANLTLAAFVTAVASLIPQQYLDARVFDLLVTAFAFVVNWLGSFIGQYHGQAMYIRRQEMVPRIRYARQLKSPASGSISP
jgi:hypothetical protein